MKKQALKKHLGIYSIYKKRHTTINHAFASAISYFDDYNEKEIDKALRFLNQKPNAELKCVYCNKKASTWDHLKCLVKNGAFTGYGHQLGNLVPCCKTCNSSKGKKDYSEYIDKIEMDIDRKIELKAQLEKYSAEFICNKIEITEKKYEQLTQEYDNVKQDIFKLMQKADSIAEHIRSNFKNNATSR